jgi:hypothetical protein
MEIIEDRNYNVLELPYSKNKVWILERIKGKDMKIFEGKAGPYELLSKLIKKMEHEGQEIAVDIEEMDIVDLNYLADYVEGLTNIEKVDREAKKK